MPSPVGFDRNIIVWVDDIPKNNEKVVQKIIQNYI